MSLKSHLFTRGKATGTGVVGQKKRKIKTKIYSEYNLCSSAPEELTVSLTSTYFLCIEQKEYLVASLASVYSLETAPT